MFLEFEDFIYDCEVKGLSEKTIKSYRNHIQQFLQYTREELKIDRINKIKHIHVKKYLQHKKQNGCKERYINSIIKVLRVFFSYCEKEEYIVTNPMYKVPWSKEQERVIETFNDEEVKNLLKAYEFSDYLNTRNKTLIAIFVDTGIRTTECINIKHDDIQKDRILIYGKGNKQRFVPISMQLKKYMNKYERIKEIYFNHKKDEIPNNYFLSRTGRPLTVEAIERIWKIAGEIASVRKNIRCTGHTARHYYAVKMLETNDIYTVAQYLGHSSTKITEVYLKALTSQKLIDKGQINSPLMNLKGGRK